MNLPDLKVFRDGHRILIGVVTSGHYEGFRGCYWTLYDDHGERVGWGESKGWDGNGCGSALSAMKLARRAAMRRFRAGMAGCQGGDAT